MPRRVSKKEDEIQAARRVIDTATGVIDPPPVPPREKNPAAVALGKLGGSKGGLTRAANLSAKRRTEIAKKAARSRWGK